MSYRPARWTWNQPLYTARDTGPASLSRSAPREDKDAGKAREAAETKGGVCEIFGNACLSTYNSAAVNLIIGGVARSLYASAAVEPEARARSLGLRRTMVSPLGDLARGRSAEAEAGFAHCYRTKILFAVGGFMGLADLRPLPISFLVRYKLIDSCSRYLSGVSRLLSRWARAVKKSTTKKTTRERKKREKESKNEVEVAYKKGNVISRRALERNWIYASPIVAPARPSTYYAAAFHAKPTNVLIH